LGSRWAPIRTRSVSQIHYFIQELDARKGGVPLGSRCTHLRKQQQAISAKIFGTIGKALEEPGALTDWLNPGASRKASDVDVVASTKGAMAA
jgi:hypothetical protein